MTAKQIDEMSELSDKFSRMTSFDFSRAIKLKTVSAFMAEKYNNPSLSKTEICKKINVSLPTLNQNLKDLNYSDFVRKRSKNIKKKTVPSNPKKRSGKKPAEELLGGSVEEPLEDPAEESLEVVRDQAKELLKNYKSPI